MLFLAVFLRRKKLGCPTGSYNIPLKFSTNEIEEKKVGFSKEKLFSLLGGFEGDKVKNKNSVFSLRRIHQLPNKRLRFKMYLYYQYQCRFSK